MEKSTEDRDWEEFGATHKPYLVKKREEFARRLKREMRFAKLSAEFLSFGTGIEREDMQKYMNGEEFPSVENLLRICNFMQILSTDLLGT